MSSSTPPDRSNCILVEPSYEENGQSVFEVKLTPKEDKRVCWLLMDCRSVVPVIFLPGTMGSNLKFKDSTESVWRPPNITLDIIDTLSGIASVFVWGFRGPKSRQKRLDMDKVEVDDSGKIGVGSSGLTQEEAYKRGWGTVHYSSYGKILALMQERLNCIYRTGDLQGWWRTDGMADPADYGLEQDYSSETAPLTETELKWAAHFRHDVWCAGYNWLKSCRDIAGDIKKYIDETVIPSYREKVSDKELQSMKVILVTHSMGGLVGRALTRLVGYDRVLGVVHGQMPATGSSAAYHHMRCGYEGVSALVLGWNAGEVLAVAARSPSCLELLPSQKYREGKPWLFVRDGGGKILPRGCRDCRLPDCKKRVREQGKRAYPSSEDPFEAIYKNPSWYGLVPAENEKYLNMLNQGDDPDNTGRRHFEKLLNRAKEFQNDLHGLYHDNTYVHYGADPKMHSWRDVSWRGDPLLVECSEPQYWVTHRRPEDNGKGKYRCRLRRESLSPSTVIEIAATGVLPWPEQQPTMCEDRGRGGDEVVPTDSGQAPAGEPGVQAIFRHPRHQDIRCDPAAYFRQGVTGYDHQNSYSDSRAQWATFYGIVKIIQKADWHPHFKVKST